MFLSLKVGFFIPRKVGVISLVPFEHIMTDVCSFLHTRLPPGFIEMACLCVLERKLFNMVSHKMLHGLTSDVGAGLSE